MEKQTTLLDLNIYVLDKIFKEIKCITDKINLAKIHPYLTEAFAFYGRLEFKAICPELINEDELLFVLRKCSEHIQTICCFTAGAIRCLQLIADNCPNVENILLDPTDINCNEILPSLARFSLRTLRICVLPIDKVILLIKNCKTLRILEIYQSNDLNINSIRTILDILDENGVKPDAPFTLDVGCYFKHFDYSLISEISKLKKCNLLNFEYESTPDF